MSKLLGIVLIAVGFAFRWNALLVVLLAGIATGLLAGFSFREIVQLTGRFFVDNRALTLPVILLVPVVGILERHGLQQRVAALMRRAKAATPGRVLWIYQVVRGVSSMFGMSIGNHASMVRPLVVPMAEAAAAPRAEAAHAPRAEAGFGDPALHCGNEAGSGDPALQGRGKAGFGDPALQLEKEAIRAHAAAAENVGNFFADDIFVAVGALLLIKGFYDTVDVPVSLRDIQLWSAPTAVAVIVIGWWRYRVLDARLRRARGGERTPGEKGVGA